MADTNRRLSDKLQPPLFDQTKSCIYLQKLRFNAAIGPDAWGRSGKEQPVVISIRLQRDIHGAATSDDVDSTVNYSTICKEVLAKAQSSGGHDSVNKFHTTIHDHFLHVHEDWKIGYIELETRLPKAILHADGGLTTRSFSRSQSTACSIEARPTTCSIEGLKVACIIGVNPHEREVKQTVNIDLLDLTFGSSATPTSSRDFARIVCQTVESSSFETVEALAYRIAYSAVGCQIKHFTVSVQKPSAIPAVEGAGVEISCQFEDV